MALTKATLDNLKDFITDKNGVLSTGETQVIDQIKDLSSGGEITQVDLVKLQWSISRYTLTASVFGSILKEFSDSLKQGANRLS